MNEEEYQRDKFYEKYKGVIPKKFLKDIFDKAWYSGYRLGDIMKTATYMAETWIKAKVHYGHDK